LIIVFSSSGAHADGNLAVGVPGRLGPVRQAP